MTPSFPEHRFYTVLALLQVGMIMIGTFAIRFVTAESLAGYYKPAPAMAVWIRDWGYVFLLVPAAWVVLSIRAARKEDADRKLGRRIAIGLLVTVLVGSVFGLLWEQSSIVPRAPIGGSWSN
jgi:hypothetical protein